MSECIDPMKLCLNYDDVDKICMTCGWKKPFGLTLESAIKCMFYVPDGDET